MKIVLMVLLGMSTVTSVAYADWRLRVTTTERGVEPLTYLLKDNDVFKVPGIPKVYTCRVSTGHIGSISCFFGDYEFNTMIFTISSLSGTPYAQVKLGSAGKAPAVMLTLERLTK